MRPFFFAPTVPGLPPGGAEGSSRNDLWQASVEFRAPLTSATRNPCTALATVALGF